MVQSRSKIGDAGRTAIGFRPKPEFCSVFEKWNLGLVEDIRHAMPSWKFPQGVSPPPFWSEKTNGDAKVRVVFPAFEGEKVWIATKPSFAKTAQIALDPRVELFWENGVSRPAPHLTLTGVARRIDDQREKDRVWSSNLFGYNLAEFWPSGTTSRDLTLIQVSSTRVELGWQPAMWAGEKPAVWRADAKSWT